MPGWTKLLVAALPDLTRSHIQKLIKAGRVRVNGSATSSSRRLKSTDIIIVEIPAPATSRLEPEDIALEVIYEDPDMAVIDEPQWLSVYPAPGRASHTLVNALPETFPGHWPVSEIRRGPALCTGWTRTLPGLIVVARNEKSRLELINQFKSQVGEKSVSRAGEGKA